MRYDFGYSRPCGRFDRQVPCQVSSDDVIFRDSTGSVRYEYASRMTTTTIRIWFGISNLYLRYGHDYDRVLGLVQYGETKKSVRFFYWIRCHNLD